MKALRSALAVAVLALVGSVAATATPADAVPATPAAPKALAWTNGVCTDASGVTVVIDFQELGGGVHVRCAPQRVGSGFEALKQAGIDYNTTVRFPGFLCKIAGKPENDPCQTASPATAYWSYWLATRGGSWCYSNWGAGNRTPPPGSVEGWSFSYNKSASTSPPPRLAVPGPLAGTNPGLLPHNDCDPGFSGNPAPPVTAPATPGAAKPVDNNVPLHERRSDGGQGQVDPGAAATPAPATPPAQDQLGPASDPGLDAFAEAPGTGHTPPTSDVPTVGDTSPEPQVKSATETPSTSTTAVGEDVADDDETDDGVAFADEETAAVDLSGTNRKKGSPIGVIVAVVLVAALGGGAFVVNRRRVSAAEQ